MILNILGNCNQLENVKTAKSILPGYWQPLSLFTLSYVEYKQFDSFSFLLNGKSIEGKVPPSILLEFRAVLFQT